MKMLLLALAFGANVAAISVSPNYFSTTYRAGDPAPSPRNVTVQFARRYTSLVSTNPAGWLTVSPTSGSVPAVLQVQVRPQGLTAGEYTGLITISDPDYPSTTLGASDVIRVTLTVTGTTTTTPTTTSPAELVLPQLADGGGWRSSITLIETLGASQQVTISFWDRTGRPWSVPLQGYGSVTSVRVTVPSRGVLILETSGLASFTASGWASIAGSIKASAMFAQRPPGRPEYEVATVAWIPDEGWIFPMDETAAYANGLAIVNAASTAVTYRLWLISSSGHTLVSRPIQIGPRQQWVGPLSSLVPESTNVRGTFQIHDSTGSVVALLMRFSPAGPITNVMPAYVGPMTF